MTRPFSWHTLRLQIPEAWEMTLYGRDAGCGSLEFSTLDGPQARISCAPKRIYRGNGLHPRTDPPLESRALILGFLRSLYQRGLVTL